MNKNNIKAVVVHSDEPYIHCMATWKGVIEVDARIGTILTTTELRAVLEHEKTHIRQHHVHIRMAMRYIITFMFWRLMMKKQFKKGLLVWAISIPVQTAYNWAIEFLADNGAYREGYGEYMISALKKIQDFSEFSHTKNSMTHPSTNIREIVINKTGAK